MEKNVQSLPAETLQKTALAGEITRVRYENTENGFAVLSLNDGRDEFILCGTLSGLHAGQNIEAQGAFVTHPEFGMQFKVESYRLSLPKTREGLIRFLGSSIPGIGPRTAEAIVQHFGMETLKVLDHYPKRLQEVPKIGPKKAESIAAVWKDSTDRRDSMIFLQGLGITPAYCTRLFRRYGDQAADTVRANPYKLAEEVDGIGFLKADAVARSLGFDESSVERLTAAAVFALNTRIGDGHVCCPEPDLLQDMGELTKLPQEQLRRGIDNALERHLIKKKEGFFYTPLLARAEEMLPRSVALLAGCKKFAGQRIGTVPPLSSERVLDVLQLQAVDSVSRSPLCIITGGPGVGKTTVVGEIVRRALKARLRVQLAAPTGRAAKRLSESTGQEAKTLHRLLQFDPATNRFSRDADNPLSCDLLIIDEVSMLDLLLAWSLFLAIEPGCSVVLVGDADQLPSVGPGRILHDFMESGLFAVTRLTRIFRQAAGSGIICNAHAVNAGRVPRVAPPPPGELGDFYWIEPASPESALHTVEKLVAERIPQRFGFDPLREIQVLCPMNRGSCGTSELNTRLAALLKKQKEAPCFQFGTRSFRLHDKVMQTSNNYDKGVFNGDLGFIEKIDPEAKKFTVGFDAERFIEYAFDEADQLTLAYAITIHKSQGSEFPAVVLPLLTQHFVMLQRNLLYTGMTRAKKLLILVADRKAVELAVRNARVRPRCSRLDQELARMREELAKKTPFPPISF